MRKPQITCERASQWGQWLALHFLARGESNPFLLAARLGLRVILEHEEDACLLTPLRIAEWDGSRRTIRIFLPILRRYVGDSAPALHRACAHELFHGLAACKYRVLPLPAVSIPALSYRDEETAAQAFSQALLLEEKSCPPSASR
ncbi:MAG: hypothetical protein ACREOI_08935 [bacterium]